jgi:hypothetical protein
MRESTLDLDLLDSQLVTMAALWTCLACSARRDVSHEADCAIVDLARWAYGAGLSQKRASMKTAPLSNAASA